MPDLVDDNDFILTLFIYLSPLITAILVSFINYYLNFRSQRKVILLQGKIPNIQKIQDKLIEFKRYLNCRISYLETQEISPYDHEENLKGLQYRTELTEIIDFFGHKLNEKSKLTLKEIDQMSDRLCSNELAFIGKPEGMDIETGYIKLSRKIIELIDKSVLILNEDKS